MSRTNIFELLKKNNNIERDAKRILTLFTDFIFAEIGPRRYTLKELVDLYCFSNWKWKGRCLDLEDFMDTVGLDDPDGYSPQDLDDFINMIEVIYNFWYLAGSFLVENEYKGPFSVAVQLKDLMDDCLSEYNYKAFYFSDKEQCIITEDSPQVTAAAEASEPSVALEIVRYNHRQMRGDIEKKKAVIKMLFDHLEGRKREITAINTSLYDCISGGLNNLNIRHNNINPANKATYKKAVAEMPAEELEKHYDDLYQLILLAILEMDNVQRKSDMKELIKRVCE